MKWENRIAPAFALGLFAITAILAPQPGFAAEDDDKARSQFEELLEAIKDRSFEKIKSAIDKTDLTNRVYAIRPVDRDVRQVFNDNYWEIVESIFLNSVPKAKKDSRGEILDFNFQDGKGIAVVRYRRPQYNFTYQIWELRHDSRQRLKIVDWHDTDLSQKFSVEIAQFLITAIPSRSATRNLLTNKSPSDRELFQVTEILKAARDGQPERFFEIYDDLGADTQKEPVIAKFAIHMAFAAKDNGRFAQTLQPFSNVYGSEPDYALSLSDAYLVVGNLPDAYAQLVNFHENFDVNEGAIPARLSALALAVGKSGEAQKYALEATEAEPQLELAWWSLLRMRASTSDFQGATEALTKLEDDFGLRFDVAKLRRDPFRGFLSLAQSQEFKDWHAGRH